MSGRGGWRYGAGRKATRPRAEECAVLDVQGLRKRGALCAGDHGAIDAGSGVRLWYRAKPGFLTLHHEFGGRIFQVVEIDSTPANLGVGERMWLRCPREGCDQRCRLLFLPPGDDVGFACRRCARVTYPSQRLGEFDRADRRRSEILALLGPGGSRPPGMRARTFFRLARELAHAESVRASAFIGMASTLLRGP